MANPSTAHEPSMEEILASIRQIISEDGEPSNAAARPQPKAASTGDLETAAEAKAEDAQAADVHAEPASSSTAARREAAKPPNSDLASRPAAPAAMPPSGPVPGTGLRRSDAAPAAQPTLPPQRPGRAHDDRNLLSADSDAAVSGAFSALAHTILAQNARTLEDLVVEMLQPMLREWLDENLPALVERLVQEEIERVSRGRR